MMLIGMAVIAVGLIVFLWADDSFISAMGGVFVILGILLITAWAVTGGPTDEEYCVKNGGYWVSESQIIEADGTQLIADEHGTCFRVVVP